MPKKVTNLVVAGALILGVFGIGVVAYRQKAQADTIVAGYATAHIHFNITVPVIQPITVKATFTPKSDKNFYFKERSFDLTAAGLNTVEWYIRKIPGGTYTLTLASPQGTISGAPKEVSLKNDEAADVGSFDLNLGSPPKTETPQPTETLESTSTTTTSANATASTSQTATSDQIPFPPIPSL